MVTKDYVGVVAGGTCTIPFAGATKFQTLGIVPADATMVWDLTITDDAGYVVFQAANNTSPTTFLAAALAVIPTLNKGGNLVLSNATKPGAVKARIYSELSESARVQR